MAPRTILLSVLFGLLPLVSPARETRCPEIRSGHPRIFFNPDTWPEVQARAEGPAQSYLKALVEECDKMTDNPVCSNTGPVHRKAGKQPDGTYISIEGSAISNIVEFGLEAAKCALAWRFTGDEKYLVKGYKMLKASVDGYTEATDNRRPVNWFSTGRINALCAYDWMYEGLTDAQRREVIVPLVEHVRLIQPEAGLHIPRQPAGRKDTGFYGMASLLWYAGLAADGDGYCDSLARDMLHKGYKLYMEVLENRELTSGDDGALISPAPNYACVAYPAAHFNFFSSFASATGIDLARDYPNMALFPYWVWWTWIRDSDNPKDMRIPGIADSHHAVNTVALDGLMYEHLSNYMWYFRKTNPEASAFAAALREYLPEKTARSYFPATPFLISLERDPDPKLTEAIGHPSLKARHFETLGQFIMRSGWTPEDTYCTFNAGASIKQHKHYDENSFVIYKHDHLALDTGDRAAQDDLNLVYYYAQSVAHNLVLIQQPGEPLPYYWGPKTDEAEANLCYGGQVNNKPAKVLAFETGDDFTYVASDAAACYGPKAKECVRQFVYVYPDYFIVYDRVASSDPSYRKDWLLHFNNRPVVKGNLVRADSGEGRLFCQTLLPRDPEIEVIGGPGREFWVRDRNYPINPKVVEKTAVEARKRGRGPYYGAWRIELRSQRTPAEERFLNVLTATSTESSRPVKAKLVRDGSRDGVTLTVKGKKMTFWFNREGPVGGDVCFGKTSRPLTREVQPQAGLLM